MDRYITRERRVAAEYPEGNQMIAFATTSTGNNNIIKKHTIKLLGAMAVNSFLASLRIYLYSPEHMYYNAYNSTVQGPEMHYSAPQMQTYSPNVMQTGRIMPGYDTYPRYLTPYSDNNAAYIAGPMHMEPNPNTAHAFGSDYQNRSLMGAERVENKHYMPQRIPNVQLPEPFNYFPKPTQNNAIENIQVIQKKREMPPKKQVETDLLKSEVQNEVKPRAEKLKVLYTKGMNDVGLTESIFVVPLCYFLGKSSQLAKELYKTGTRVFCGSVENVLKWHKMIQDIGVMVLYDIVGKCVSVRAGKSCAKNLVVRDENGPAVQVVYYEIDYLLPELQIPCTVRVLGPMQQGTSRLHAYSVRAAAGDDVATLPRRAAVAAHHVAKLSKEYST